MSVLTFSNLPFGFHNTYYNMEKELEATVANVGEVESVVCDTTEYGTYIGTATVTMKSADAALKASHDLMGAMLLDKPMEVFRA